MNFICIVSAISKYLKHRQTQSIYYIALYRDFITDFSLVKCLKTYLLLYSFLIQFLDSTLIQLQFFTYVYGPKFPEGHEYYLKQHKFNKMLKTLSDFLSIIKTSKPSKPTVIFIYL
jgi:hypothetical protein